MEDDPITATQELTLRSSDSSPMDQNRDNSVIRVMVVMPLSEQRGGGELMFLHLIQFGRRLGIEWSVAFFADGPMAGQVRDWNVPTYSLRAGRFRHPHRMVAAIWKLRRLLRRNKINAVLSFMGKGQIYGGAAAALAGVPAVWYQLAFPDPPSWQDRLATAIPSRLVLTCSNAATDAQAKIWPRRPVRTIYPGVELDRFDASKLPTPQECRRKLGLPSTGPLVGIVGRLQHWKGMHHLVDAMQTILKQHPDAHAVIVGGPHAFEPDYPAQLQMRISKLGLGSRVILAGPQENVPKWMQAMDVIVHASENEPFGIVIIEAMALGKPVIAAESAGPTEIITNEVNGLLWNTARSDNLAESILRCLNNPNWAEKIANRATNRAAEFAACRFATLVALAVSEAVAANFEAQASA